MPAKIFFALIAVVLLAGAVTAALIASLPPLAVAALLPVALAAAWLVRRQGG